MKRKIAKKPAPAKKQAGGARQASKPAKPRARQRKRPVAAASSTAAAEAYYANSIAEMVAAIVDLRELVAEIRDLILGKLQAEAEERGDNQIDSVMIAEVDDDEGFD